MLQVQRIEQCETGRAKRLEQRARAPWASSRRSLTICLHQLPGGCSMTFHERARMQTVPELVLKKPTRDEWLGPERSRWPQRLTEQVGECDRSIEVDHRESRSF